MIRSFNGKTPKIAESAFVSEAAYVIGDVELGENSGVWPGAVVRGDFANIRIGANTMIEDGSIVHSGTPVEIGDNVLIGHSVVAHGSKIGSNVLIGNNATILDGAIIGNFCVIGAGCLVSQGMEIPDNSFVVGAPAKIKGQISEERRAGLRAGPGSYIELMKRYKQEGL
jgi:carbonic anhydrase/acetyltransferase-like protein (isoleucine patch superfamily)